MATQKKNVIVNVYDPAVGTLLATWTKFTFDGFTKEINSGPSECVIKLDKPFDYGGADVLLGNQVELRVADKDTVALASNNGTRIIYRGYISLIERDASGTSERLTVHVLGYYTLLALDVLKDGTQTTLYSESSSGLTTTSGDQDAADIGLMVRTVIDRYRTENTSPKISYDIDDIPNTSTTADYSFQQKTYREALDDLLALAPTGTFYFIDELGKIKFKSKPTTPTHKFVFGKHFNAIHVEHSLEKMRNILLVWDGTSGGTYKHYEDADSIETYGRRAERLTDFGIHASGAADLLGARYLADNKRPDIKVTCTILDNNGQDTFGYDIESIQPGDTCSFFGFATGFDDILRENMLITRVRYELDKVELDVELVKSGLLDTQDRQGRDISDINSGGLGVPATYS
jgi:hypothetical protein